MITTISERHGREGVSRAITVLCTTVKDERNRRGQQGGEVVFNAALHPDLPGDQRAILVRSARLAGDLLSATLTHDGARLAEALGDIAPATFDPVLSMLASYAAEMLDSTHGVRARILTAPDYGLCPTTKA